MIYKNIKVEIPSPHRIQKRGDVSYVYKIITRVNKENVKDKVAVIGLKADKNTMYPNHRYFELYPDKKELLTTDEPSTFAKQLSFGSYFVIDKIFKDLGLWNDLVEAFETDNASLIETLVIYNLITRDSASQLLQYFLFDNYVGLNYIPDEARISKLFNTNMSHNKILAFKSLWLKRTTKDSASLVVDIDSTNSNVNSNNISLAEKGHPKVDEDLPQVNEAIIFDRATNMPIYFDTFYGSINDCSHFKTFINKIKIENTKTAFSIILDRRYCNSVIINQLLKEFNEYSFCIMGTDNTKLNELIDEFPTSVMESPSNSIDGNIFGIVTKGKPFKSVSKDLNLYLFYNPWLNQKIYSETIQKLDYACETLINKKDSSHKIRDTWSKKIDFVINENDIIIEAKPNTNYLIDIKKHSGYFWMMSNEELSTNVMLKQYRGRDGIEKEFKHTKSGCDLDKTYAQSDACFEAKKLIGFICGCIRSYIINTMRSYFLQYPKETSQTVLCELNKIKMEKINNEYLLSYTITKLQAQIISLFDLTKSDVFKVIKDKNFVSED